MLIKHFAEADVKRMKKLTIVKFGGSLLDLNNVNIPLIVQRIEELRCQDNVGPIAVFSAPRRYTDMLIEIGESRAQSKDINVKPLFEPYKALAKRYVNAEYQQELLDELDIYFQEVEGTLVKLNKRFEGNNKARVLTSGGELPTAALMDYVLRSRGIDSCHISKEKWPIITDDNYENATPIYEASKKRVSYLIDLLEEGKVISQAGFLGMTSDGLETLLGRGGSDQVAVFTSCLLKDKYEVDTLLLKETPIQSADPAIVTNQKLHSIRYMTYNEAIKATVTGMKIVQSAAVRLAREFKLPLKVAPIENMEMSTIIQAKDPTSEIVKCITGTKGCAILTISNDRSKSLEDCLRLWESYEDFLDLGTEVLETGKVVRDFLLLDANFVKKHEERLRSFDEQLEIEYGVGVVTLIGDRMRDSPGIASIAISAIPNINIKRAVFAPHTSQIILVLDERDVETAVRSIHAKRSKMNRRTPDRLRSVK
ncbi:aspartate kinase [Candidatus Bathyarchaeota archaeon]|nr:aspartate kinase [Candidatus Bathyarchaeota archaeon]